MLTVPVDGSRDPTMANPTYMAEEEQEPEYTQVVETSGQEEEVESAYTNVATPQGGYDVQVSIE